MSVLNFLGYACTVTRPKSFATRPRAKQPIKEAIKEAIMQFYNIYTFKSGLMLKTMVNFTDISYEMSIFMLFIQAKV